MTVANLTQCQLTLCKPFCKLDTMSSEISETRENILKATIDALIKQGGKGVRMGDIAKASGISRQAVYLHFASRTELLVAATLHLDKLLDVDSRLRPSRTAATGEDRLEKFIAAWGAYVPEIYGVAKALMLAEATDEAAATAWQGRMVALKEGCDAAISMLEVDGRLSSVWTASDATDWLWALLQVPNWECLTQQCGWSHQKYTRHIQALAKKALMD